MFNIKRGSVFTVDLSATIGEDEGNIRPAVVIQNDIGNKHSSVVIVAAITSGQHTEFPVNVPIPALEGGLLKDSLVLLNQLRTVDKGRLRRYWGQLSDETMAAIDKAIKISLALD